MAWRGSISRSLISTVRSSPSRTSPSLNRLRPPPPPHSRRFSSFTNPRALGCAQSMLPLVGGVRLTSHLSLNVRAFCELSNGTFCRSCPDR